MQLREARFKCDLTQWDLTIKTGISQTKISHIERGYIQPVEGEISKLSKALNVPADKLEFSQAN